MDDEELEKYIIVTTNNPPLRLIAKQLIELYEKVEQDKLREQIRKKNQEKEDLK